MARPRIVVMNEFDQIVESVPFEPGTVFADAAMGNWPDGFPGNTVFILDHDRQLVRSEAACRRRMRENEMWTIALRPQGFLALAVPGFLGSIGITWLQVAVTALTLISNFILRPDIPSVGPAYQWDDSDRPQFFSAQSNQLRPGSRVPEVFGSIRVWPSLIAEPWVRYDGDVQSVDELYIVSNGLCTITEARLHDESVAFIGGSTFTVYEPGDAWPVDYPVMKTNQFVGSVDLPGPNENAAFAGDIVITNSTTNSISIAVDGYFEAFRNNVGAIFAMSGTGLSAGNVDLYRVTGVSADGRSMNLSPAPPIAETVLQGSGTVDFRMTTNCVVDQFGDPLAMSAPTWSTIYLTPPLTDARVITDSAIQGPGFGGTGQGVAVGTIVDVTDVTKEIPGQWSPTLTVSDGTTYTNRYWTYNFYTGQTPNNFYFLIWAEQGSNPQLGPGATDIFSIPGTSRAVEFDVEFPSGLFQQKAGGAPAARTVQYIMGFRLKGSGDPWKTLAFESSGLTRTPRRFTHRIVWDNISTDYTDPTGGTYPNPGDQPNGDYECYFQRITLWEADTQNQTTSDSMRLIGLRGQQVVTGTPLENDVLNCTMVRLQLSTQNSDMVLSERSFNVLARRWLPNWANGDGNTMIRTSRTRDAIMYTLMASGQYDLQDIDRDGLNAIDADLLAIGDEDARFHGIIDQTMTVEDQLQMMTNVSRIIMYRRAAKVYFERVKAGLLPVALINSRNKLGPESKSMNFSLANEPDGIIIRYMNAQDDHRESSVQYPVGPVLLNPSEQSVIGITDPTVAARMAQYLYDVRIYERNNVTVSTTEESVLLYPGAVIAMTDHLAPSPPLCGEIVEVLNAAQGGYRLDQPIPDGTYVARLRDRVGAILVSNLINVTGGEDATIFVPEWANALMIQEPTAQVGLLYSFTPVDDADGDLYTVMDVQPTQDRTVQLTLRNYDERSYAADTATPAVTRAMKRRRV